MEPKNDCKYDVNGFYSSNKTQVLLDLIYKISATFLLFLKNHPAYIMPHCNQKKQQVKSFVVVLSHICWQLSLNCIDPGIFL